MLQDSMIEFEQDWSQESLQGNKQQHVRTETIKWSSGQASPACWTNFTLVTVLALCYSVD